ncbi:uncharacterized protein LOC122289100 isoform X1 [Carya illinoinensis]|nr:uncharacterized protein LOC122289100 isoform X1 [Carya illinoinensis]
MGKRKERRLAAQSNAGRRVKLDLCAEPSGDLGGSTEYDEIGVDKDSNHRDGLPNSPTSSGQQPQNPLLLLGQYSDDEFDEESNQGLNHAVAETFSSNEEVKPLLDEECKYLDVNIGEDLFVEKVKQQDSERESIPPDITHNLESCDKGESNPTTLGDLQEETELTEQNSVSGTSDAQVVGDVILGWKMVMHEESNRYYYWNTETGETSWEVPDVLAQETGLTNGLTIPTVTEKTVCASMAIGDSNIISDAMLGVSSAAHLIEGTTDANMVAHGLDAYGHERQGYRMDDCSEAYKNETQKDSNLSTDVNASELGARSEKYMLGTEATKGYELGVDLSSHLVKQCECLLERLKPLKGSHHMQGLDWVLEYILEVEIRLSDLKSLSYYGSSLLPFWTYTEKQLKRIESGINDEISKIAESAHMDEVEGTRVSTFNGKGELQETMRLESEANGTETKGVLSASVDTSMIVQKDFHGKAPHVNAEDISSSPTRGLRNDAGVSEVVNEAELGDESNHKHGFNGAEDVDMDVDMEVEDATSSGNTALNPTQLNLPADCPFLVPEDGFTVPPPPDEEWIPPPPPDNEHIPPPPPDEPPEPPEPSYPPPLPYMETGHPLTYTEQYNLSYPVSSFEYHGHTVAEMPSSNLYGHAEGSQVAVPHAPIYYNTVPSTFTNIASDLVNPVQPIVYYEVQDGTVPAVPVVSGVESSGFQSEPAPVSYDTFSAEQVAPVNSFVGVGHNSLLNVNANISGGGGETDKASIEVPSTSATVQAPSTISVKDNFPVPPTDSISAAVVTATSLGTKVQSKGLRSKKRTIAAAPSLRSNKKVSSLVDKWKAAKEELLEDEKEPEDPYEILERKRQREIEEWHARQIATGEAKDNANFQPLGGDWRERVKRRRAQLANKAAKTPPEANTGGNQQTDLIELSRDLPSGWQAYWDETSKQVYYGNSDTTETTWTRPTK